MLDSILQKIKENKLNVDIDLITKAYNFAFDAHKDQKRESGEPYIIHPICVSEILVDLGMDTNTIIAGLLHDVIEDTPYTYDDIKNLFNDEVANLVDGVTKLGKIKYMTKEEQQAENVRKMLLAMAKDIRVIIIKLADRLHNLRTLKFKSPEKQKEKAKETFDIYAPLAHRLGISKIKWELEDLAFRYLHPDEYYDLVKQIAEKRVEREAYIKKVMEDLGNNLDDAGIQADIDGRPKHFYSIYRKMVNKNKTLDQIFDLTAIRVLVGTVKDCYAVLGIVHTIYKPIPGRFKDYIAMPKPNMYQSLHTTVIGPQGKTFEIQIRTFEMHKTAEYGIAAHWKYKEVGSEVTHTDSFETKLSWLRDMLEWQKETSDAEEFMEGFKMDLFTDEIFVFTPKGVVINLPKDATPVDFAYKIHTDIGNRCVGAKINGKMVTLDHKLKTGEIIEILTSAVAKGPNMDWLTFVTSNQAKTKIKQWFRKTRRVENLDKGKELLEKECKKQLVNFSDFSKSELFAKIFKKYNFNSIDDVYAAVGAGMLLASSLVLRLKEETTDHHISNEQILKMTEEQAQKNEKKDRASKGSYGITVKGVENIMVRFSKCCSPVPGDEIVGFITKGRGVSIHRKDCTNLKSMSDEEKERLVEVSWGEEKGKGYSAEFQVEAEDRTGLLADIMQLITNDNLQLTSLNAKSLKNGVAVMNVMVTVDNKEKLNTLMKKIKAIRGVIEVYRMNS
ncbi:MAG: bifunctional (p)ppGpp synthetase/guanosine-3',5'-bis(diphosphate) 3'-pyrophosphohydrolase [Inconstantimicrobium porci]|uniref:RelA/SpoT family protein n=1 Tax=Inconstantimicrobium porci TaxID=2652291 RepID=UPI002A91C497|nr:bifunctional (p)ppGpp synthetase/guanosine-3',5'-bis(diphosphate) 3'-pyrophosphohydrolase [Inconstantimicrobium porci]MDY5912516.1 bifunctional (p)ppGpp synthetase/guanosine-3',5'-bis(diphosphate) 3'-pyrophosphohydrolase [Inconstantimicrobium porci]